MPKGSSPKARILTENETKTSIESWINIMEYLINENPKFRLFAQDATRWLKNTPANINEYRGFRSTMNGYTAAEKCEALRQMLSWISTFLPGFLANDIVNNSTSL